MTRADHRDTAPSHSLYAEWLASARRIRRQRALLCLGAGTFCAGLALLFGVRAVVNLFM